MEIIFIGTGSAFTLKNNQTNLLIKQNDKLLLVDAGGDLRFSLQKMGLSYKDLDAAYISHLHSDHSSGLEYLAFCTYFDPFCKDKKIQLYGNNEILRKGWNDTWKGGLESIQGKILSLESFFDVNMIKPNGSFIWEGLKFEIVQSVHIFNGYFIVPSFGLIITDDKTNKKIYLTNDIQFCPNQIVDFYKMVDIIIQDCETMPFKSGVHANYSELKDLPAEIKAKMFLVHFNDNVYTKDDSKLFTPEFTDEWKQKPIQDGFRGLVPQGSTLVIDNEIDRLNTIEDPLKILTDVYPNN